MKYVCRIDIHACKMSNRVTYYCLLFALNYVIFIKMTNKGLIIRFSKIFRLFYVENFSSMLPKNEQTLVVFYASWCGNAKWIKPVLGKTAIAIKSKGESNFFSNIHSQMGSLQESAKTPKTNQEAGFGSNVQLAYDDTFEGIIADANPTFVMFYATWCGHCSTVKPAFSRLATAFKTENSPVKIVAVDAAENPKVADLCGIENLPTFKLYAAGKFLAQYGGDRSMENMTEFIKSKVT